jgi:acetyl-CoA decarbonylase/synthase complex subunit alpha
MSKLNTGSFSTEGLESVQITINNIVGVAKEAAEEKVK